MSLSKPLTIILMLVAAVTFQSCKPGQMSVDDLLKKHYDAVGQDKLEKVQTVAMEATMNAMGNSIGMKVYFKRPKNVRTEVNMMGMTMVMVTDGTKGYVTIPNQGSKEIGKDEIEKMMPQNIAMDDQLYQAKAQGAKLTLLGKEKDGDTEYYKLNINYSGTKSDIDSAFAYVDTKSYYLTKMITSQRANNESYKATVKFSDFQTVNGVTMPYLITVSTPMTKEVPMKITKLEYNAQLSDTLFAKPQATDAAPQP